MSGSLLTLEKVTVSFDGFKALNELSLSINEGELRCIIGANGAGKSTMMDVITGKTRPDSGKVRFANNINLLHYDEAEIAQMGIGRKFQKPTVFTEHTVADNLELARKTDKRIWGTLFAKPSAASREVIDDILNTVGLYELRYELASILSHGQKQWLEIGMLLIQEPKLMLIDEPVAGMTPQEVNKTADILNSLAGTRSVVVVEHDMAFIRRIARRVTVLHQGSVLAENSMDNIQADPKVRNVYLGED